MYHANAMSDYRSALLPADAVADGFTALPEACAPRAMRLLASPLAGDPPIVAGESGGAGLAGLIAVLEQPALAASIGIGPEARVFVINTEGATDPALYEKIVGRGPDAVRPCHFLDKGEHSHGPQHAR